MHVDTGDSPPHLSKAVHFTFKTLQLGTTGGRDPRASRHHQKEASVHGPVQLLLFPRNPHLVNPPRQRMCVDFRKINDLQPQVRRVDSTTSGNISLVPLPKIDEMYAALRSAKIFTTLDLRSGYYHINLDEESKAKTAFVTPFGKYEFNSVPFGLAQAPAYFQQLISMVLQDLQRLRDGIPG